jgi:hypothetical protein
VPFSQKVVKPNLSKYLCSWIWLDFMY